MLQHVAQQKQNNNRTTATTAQHQQHKQQQQQQQWATTTASTSESVQYAFIMHESTEWLQLKKMLENKRCSWFQQCKRYSCTACKSNELWSSSDNNALNNHWPVSNMHPSFPTCKNKSKKQPGVSIFLVRIIPERHRKSYALTEKAP